MGIHWIEILQIVSEESGVSTEEILSKKRYRYVLAPRYVLCWIAREYIRLGHETIPSYPWLGKKLNRHHTSIMYMKKEIDNGRFPELQRRVENRVRRYYEESE